MYQVNDAGASPLNDFYIQQALARYYLLPQDAQTLSTAGSTIPVCRNSICTYLNPAGLGFMQSKEFSATLGRSHISGDDFPVGEEIEQGENQGYGLISVPLRSEGAFPDYGTISFGFSRYQGDTNDSIHTTPDGHRRSFAYGISPTEDLALGYGFTFYDDQLRSSLADLHSHARFLHILGTQYQLNESLILGAVYKLGIGQSDTEDFVLQSNGLSRPRQHTCSIGIEDRSALVTLSSTIDYSYLRSEGDLNRSNSAVVIGNDERGDMYNVRIGAQSEVLESTYLRAGFRWYEVSRYKFERSDLDALSGRIHGVAWAGGLGYELRDSANSLKGGFTRIDYGFEYANTGHGDSIHLLSLAVPF